MNFLLKILITALFYGIIIMDSVAPSQPEIEIPNTGFWAMPGEIFTHPFDDSAGSLSGKEIYELKDSNHLTIWFGRYVFKDVCISGECKMIKLWLFWDGAGNYLGLQPPDTEPLTKSDHDHFLPEDYIKLDEILEDTSSILGTMKQEELIVVPDEIDLYEAYKVDGFTAATLPTLSDVIVENAVFTCYTLWHTVYGPVREQIMEIIDNRTDEQYLNKMLGSGNSAYVKSAIQNIRKDPGLDAVFRFTIMDLIKSDNVEIADYALDYFKPDFLENEETQSRLIQTMQESDVSFTYKILWRLMESGRVHDSSVITLLKLYSNTKEDVAFLNMVLKLIEPQQYKDHPEISGMILSLKNSEVYLIRNSIQKFLVRMDKDGI